MAGPAYPNSRNRLTAMSEAAKSGNINMPGEAPKTPEARAAAGNAAGRDWASGDSREAQALRADMQKSGLEANAGAIRQDTGGWSYRDLGNGRIEVVSAPPGSKTAGKILDPNMIAAIADPVAKARAERAYASVKSVMSGGPPLAPYRPTAGKKTTPDRDMLGGERNAPVASSGRAPDPSAGAETPGFANAVIPTGRGPAINQSGAGASGPGAIDTATAPPARSFKSAPYRR
jgi:hypothetical protein